MARGRKEWVCAHGDDHALLTGGVAGGGSSDYGDDGNGPTLPDLFAEDLYEQYPHVRRARLYHGFQVRRASRVPYEFPKLLLSSF